MKEYFSNYLLVFDIFFLKSLSPEVFNGLGQLRLQIDQLVPDKL